MASLEAARTMRDHRVVGFVAEVSALSLQSSVREVGMERYVGLDSHAGVETNGRALVEAV